jgi:hypothetical protein
MTTIGLAIDEDGVTFMFPLVVVKRILEGAAWKSRLVAAMEASVTTEAGGRYLLWR